ncbi:hypothetical protein Hanom_Chr09g00813281 [Helianthus anomalus]
MDSLQNRIDKFQKLKSGSHSKSQVTRIVTGHQIGLCGDGANRTILSSSLGSQYIC